MRVLAFLVTCFVFLMEMGDCWISSSLMGFKIGAKPSCNDGLKFKKIMIGRYATVNLKTSFGSSENDNGQDSQDEENQNETSAGRNLFPFSDWSQFFPGNLSTDDAAAAGVLGMMRRAIDAGKQMNQDSAAANGDSSQVSANHHHFLSHRSCPHLLVCRDKESETWNRRYRFS
jgi:hypothetical protein